MKKRTLVNPDLIHLHKVKVIKAYLELSDEYLQNQTPFEDFELNAGSESAFDFESNLVRFRVLLSFKAMDNKGKSIGIDGEYVVDFIYQIDNLSDFLERKEESISKPLVRADLGATIAGISYSTTRGIVLERTQSSGIDGLLLPVINPAKLLDEDLVATT